MSWDIAASMAKRDHASVELPPDDDGLTLRDFFGHGIQQMADIVGAVKAVEAVPESDSRLPPDVTSGDEDLLNVRWIVR